MIRCSNCGSENAPSEVYCYSCGHLLNTEGVTTSMLREETAPVTPKRRWGTARFDVGTILIITPRDYDIPPVKIDLKQDRILGRAHKDYTPDIDLNPLDAYERGVSRQHALLRRQNDTVVVIDMNSANSTFLNGQRLMPDQPRIVRDGDEIRLGQLVLRINFEDAPL